MKADELENMVRDGLDRGLFILSDADARPAGAAHPLANLWDNGSDPVEALVETLAVRRIALDRFGESAVPEGTPLAELEEVLVPLYLHHRFQLQAAVKVIGGLEYSYALRGDGQDAFAFIDPERQMRALEVVLSILDPATLDLPESVLEQIPPRPARIREDSRALSGTDGSGARSAGCGSNRRRHGREGAPAAGTGGTVGGLPPPGRRTTRSSR